MRECLGARDGQQDARGMVRMVRIAHPAGAKEIGIAQLVGLGIEGTEAWNGPTNRLAIIRPARRRQSAGRQM